MKKYLLKIILFFIVIAVIDLLFGFVCQYMNDHSKGGGIKSRYYVCKESNEDVLVFGSSRAKHHYVPDIIEDSLGVTCYNTGEDGNGIILSYGILKMITQRYSPKLIIYDVTDFDVYEDDNMKYLDLLKPYYFEPGIDSIFWSVNSKTRYMMLSNLYRYNTTCLRVFGNYIRPLQSYPKGYAALHKTMSYDPVGFVEKKKVEDSLKIYYFEKFIQLSIDNNIKVICCLSPSYSALSDSTMYQPIRNLCDEYDIPFLDYYYEPSVSRNKLLFQDKTHMNDEGANRFTNLLIKSLNSIILE